VVGGKPLPTFKAKARRNMLLGLWAARLLGLGGDDAQAYAKSIVEIDLQPHGDDVVVEKLAQDFAAKGVSVDARRIRAELARLAQEARKQLRIPT
jgi:hypothetical protein